MSSSGLFFLCLGRDPYEMPVAVFNGESEARYGQQFLELIDKEIIIQKRFQSFDSAVQSVKSGENRALIAIGSNFTAALVRRGVEGLHVDDETVEMSAVRLFLDTTSERF